MRPLDRIASVCLAVVAAGCAQTSTPPAPGALAPEPAAATSRPTPHAKAIPAVTLDGYKKEVAARIAAKNPHLFNDPLPEMFKSIVVLDITIDRDGNLTHVGVRRSNGFKQLEARAMESVREAAPYAAPNTLVRRGGGSVQFLETFLFRADGRFQIRSLVEKT
jgi:periplasmic protein TonB